MKLTREIKTAFLVIVGIAVFIFGYSYLKGLSILDSYNTFYTEFDYNALKQASPVTIKGNQVGKITTIKYDFKTGKTRVAFTVIGELEFSKNSKVRMYDLGLMEGKGLA
ncbi:MAG: MCE family protein, partial [Flavobacteriaceae bacterium]|nr:MCE family protein [Flavobacteriaceae bacterium]